MVRTIGEEVILNNELVVQIVKIYKKGEFDAEIPNTGAILKFAKDGTLLKYPSNTDYSVAKERLRRGDPVKFQNGLTGTIDAVESEGYIVVFDALLNPPRYIAVDINGNCIDSSVVDSHKPEFKVSI